MLRKIKKPKNRFFLVINIKNRKSKRENKEISIVI